jgi:hypothetical protein
MMRGIKLGTSLVSNAAVQSRPFSDQAGAAASAIRKSFKKMANRPAVVEQRARNSELESKEQETKKSWRIVGAT